MALDAAESGLEKVVLARRTECAIKCSGMDSVKDQPEGTPTWGVDPLALLATLQARNPAAYQFCIQVGAHPRNRTQTHTQPRT